MITDGCSVDNMMLHVREREGWGGQMDRIGEEWEKGESEGWEWQMERIGEEWEKGESEA